MLGIQAIRRAIRLWNGTDITVNLKSNLKLREDLNNIVKTTEEEVN